MCHNICLKNSLYRRLKAEKGEKSFSDIIEQYMNKEPVSPICQDKNLQAANPTSNGGAAND